MAVYINGISAISPQKTFDKTVLSEGVSHTSGNRMKCIEPDYSEFIDAKQIRRMSRIIKMGVTASIKALKEAGVEKPEAVIVGTAFGCLEDTDVFLKKLVLNKEEMLNPTAFIHSTHNTIASQIALLFQCRGYNSTYVHRNISFESALLDAMMLISDKEVTQVLVGGTDELIDSSFILLNRLGYFKQDSSVSSENLYQTHSKGSIAGEGAAYFSLSDKKESDSYAQLLDVQMYSFIQPEEVVLKAKVMLAQNKIDKADILIAGYNGDMQDDKIFDSVVNGLNMQQDVVKYKHLCGEYPTSSAFAMWVAAESLRSGSVPASFGNAGKKVKNVLIYNQYKNLHHSFLLLSAC